MIRSLVLVSLVVGAGFGPAASAGEKAAGDGAPPPAPAAPVDTPQPTASVAPVPPEADPAAAVEAEKRRAAMLRELRTAEEEVHDLKERAFRSKATLQLLRELAVAGAHSGSGLRITHVDGLGRGYALQSAQFYLDGKNVWSWSSVEGGEPLPDSLQVRDQTLAPGSHTLQVSLVVKGEGRGVFEYLDDYRFNVESTYDFKATGGEVTDLTVRTVSKGGVKKGFLERPDVQYEERREPLEAR